MSSLADRIKIARLLQSKEKYSTDINLSIQFLLNCGTHMSCLGGSALRAFKFVKENGFVPFDTCLNYFACSSDSTEGFCPFVDTTCSPINTCKTCSRDEYGVGHCKAIDIFPNATIAEYGSYELADNIEQQVNTIKAEIFARGPVKASVNGTAIANYKGGIISDSEYEDSGHNHGVVIVGWGQSKNTQKQYWIVRNSWGGKYEITLQTIVF